jgi:hypothetical protein
MTRVIRLNEENLYSLIETVISELKKDINQPLWNVYRIPSKIGANGYAISSNFDERTILNQLIAFGKNKWKEGKTVVSVIDEDGSGYLFKYIITLIIKSVLENSDIVKSKMGFTKYIADNFESVVKVNEEPLTKADAEMMKREIANSDPNSFKRKGAAIFRELEKNNVQKKSLKKLTQNFQDTIKSLYDSDAIQYYDEDGLLLYHPRTYTALVDSNLPQSIKDELSSIENDVENSKDPMTGKKFSYKLKRIPNESKIHRTITSVLGITPKKIIKQKV